MSRTEQITLGEFTFTAHPFNIGEIEEIADAMEGIGSKSLREKIAAARTIILTSVKRDTPETTDADLRKIEAPAAEIFGAVAAIMRVSGYKKDEAPGEAQAGAEPAAA